MKFKNYIRKEKIGNIEDSLFDIITGESRARWIPNTRKLETQTDRNNSLLRDIWELYLQDETANSIIMAISTITLGEHFIIRGVDQDEKEKIFWETTFKRNWNLIWEVVAEALVFGNSFARIIPSKSGRFWGLQPLFPLDVTKEKRKGEVLYIYEGNEFKAADGKIFECYFFPRSDSLYATSLLAPIKTALDRKRTTEANIDTAINRHFPRFHIQVERDPITNRYPDKEKRRKIAEKFEELSPNQEFVSTDLIKIETIDSKGGVPSIESYMAWFTNSVFVGARVPPEVLGAVTRTTTHATAKARVNTFLSFIIPFYQRNLEYHIKTQLMKDTDAIIDILPPEELALPYSK